MLDIEYVNAGGAGIHSEFWGFAGRAPDDAENRPFMKWLYTLGNTSDAAAPKVFSTSYGEDEDSTSWEYANRMNAEFMKAGARGISLLYASGDEGANCERLGRAFAPEWPSSSPYVTAVGGTTYAAGGAETAASLSSGGFSARWAMPAWQRDAVGAYVAAGAGVGGFPAARLYNATGRAYPDVAAQAEESSSCATGRRCRASRARRARRPRSGRRRAARRPPPRRGQERARLPQPTVVLRRDDARAERRHERRGPRLRCGARQGGWPALAGWDAVTGWGSPNMGKMAAVTDALP